MKRLAIVVVLWLVLALVSVPLVAAQNVLYSDDFSDDMAPVTLESGWVAVADGWCLMCDNDEGGGNPVMAIQQNFTDFIVEVDTTFLSGTDDNWHVVGCRRQGQEDDGYDFCISADGYYGLAVTMNGELFWLDGPTYSSAIDQGQDAINSIRAECIGTSLRLSVNGSPLSSITDDTFSGGNVALAVRSLQGTDNEIAWDNFVVMEP